ncbi:MAG: DUF2892 domain-containing protein [Campylobacteraceae bacterium]|jgi:hypothetical protein|nr:DUF2892 domain-containing protein [Campylobacteraceae bacterium]
MVSKKSRIIRVIVGILWILVFAFGFQSWWALVGLVPLIVGATGFCPACYFLNRCSIR